MDLGCPPLRTFLTVTLPLIAPALAAGWMLAFTLSLDDLVLASFTTGPGATTLPIRIYSEVRLGVKPEINAICTIMIAVVAVGDRDRLAAGQAADRRSANARGSQCRRLSAVDKWKPVSVGHAADAEAGHSVSRLNVSARVA